MAPGTAPRRRSSSACCSRSSCSSTAIGTLVGTQVADLAQNSEEYVNRTVDFLNDNFNTDIDAADVNEEINDPDGSVQRFIRSQQDEALQVSVTVLGLLLQLFAVLFFTFYLVADGPRLRRVICSRFVPDIQRQVLDAWDLAIQKTGGYLYSRLLLALLSAFFHWVLLQSIGAPAPVALALWVGLVSQFIPVVGTYIAGALPIALVFIDSPLKALIVTVFIIVYQQVENYLFAPRITARTMEIHPAVAFGAALGGAAVLGGVGAILALPAAAMFQALASSWGQRHAGARRPAHVAAGRRSRADSGHGALRRRRRDRSGRVGGPRRHMTAIPFVAPLSEPRYGTPVRLSPLVRRVVAENPSKYSYMGTGTYIIGNGDVAVIDPGPDLDSHRDALIAALAGETVRAILVTHCHSDHSPLAAWLRAETSAPTVAYGPHGSGAHTYPVLPDDPDDIEPDPDEPASIGEALDLAFTPDVVLGDGGVVDLVPGLTIRGVYTPGHTANHLCFALDEEQALFTGDHVMGWSTTVVSPPDGDMAAYLESLRSVAGRHDALLYPTHGNPVADPRPVPRRLPRTPPRPRGGGARPGPRRRRRPCPTSSPCSTSMSDRSCTRPPGAACWPTSSS